MNTIDIVTPHKDQWQLLKFCCASISDQGSTIAQHIIQNSGTNEAFPLPNSVSKIWNESDSSMYDALNRGFSKTTSKYVAWLNSDEQYLPGALSTVATHLEQSNADLLICDVILVSGRNTKFAYRKAVHANANYVRLFGVNQPTCGFFFKRSLIEEGYLFGDKYRIVGDAEWFVRLLEAKKLIKTLPIPTSVYFVTDSNLSDTPRAIEERIRFQEGSSRAVRQLRMLIDLQYRIKRLVSGAYRRRTMDVKIYTPDHPTSRTTYHCESMGFRWPETKGSKARLPI